MQKNQVAHKRILELRKMTKVAIAEMSSKEAELKVLKTTLAELTAEKERLTELVNVVEANK